jgi:hypothetical protein
MVASVVFTATPQASAAAGDCPKGATCSWTGTNYTGTMGPVYGNNTNDQQYATWANSESVANNGSQCEDWVFSAQGYGGSSIGLQIGYGVSNESGTWMWHHLYSNHWCNP